MFLGTQVVFLGIYQRMCDDHDTLPLDEPDYWQEDDESLPYDDEDEVSAREAALRH